MQERLERILFMLGVAILLIAVGTSALVIVWSIVRFVLRIIAGSG